jgi:hypothetical protein
MHEAEGVNFRVGVPSDDGQRRRGPNSTRGYRHDNPTLEEVVNFVRGLPLPQSDIETLIAHAKKVPHGALFKFKQNYLNYLGKRKGGS